MKSCRLFSLKIPILKLNEPQTKMGKEWKSRKKSKGVDPTSRCPVIENNFAPMIENILKPALNLLEHSEMSLIMIEYYLNFK